MSRRQPLERPTLIAVTSDHHCGSTVALCPPAIALDDGGHYAASKAQQWLWQCWGDYWQKVADARKTLGARLFVVFNGDLTDGDHHGTTQILSGNPTAQAAVVDACMKIPLLLEPDALFFIRGTEAHVGKSAAFEERVAQGLKKDKRPVIGDPDTGKASWWHCRMDVHGKLLDFTHHGRTGLREHTRAGAASLHAHDIFLSHAKRGERHPDLAVRSHHHRFNDSHDAAPTRVVTTGAWQLATAYVHRVAADSLADIGGLLMTVREGAPIEVEKVEYRADRGAVWKPRREA